MINKTIQGARVTKNPHKPPTVGGKMHLGVKSAGRAATHSRVNAHAPGWGQTVKGYEGKCPS